MAMHTCWTSINRFSKKLQNFVELHNMATTFFKTLHICNISTPQILHFCNRIPHLDPTQERIILINQKDNSTRCFGMMIALHLIAKDTSLLNKP